MLHHAGSLVEVSATDRASVWEVRNIIVIIVVTTVGDLRSQELSGGGVALEEVVDLLPRVAASSAGGAGARLNVLDGVDARPEPLFSTGWTPDSAGKMNLDTESVMGE